MTTEHKPQSRPVKNAYRAENKVIHVGTPGIFHFSASGCNETRCGRDMADARMTDHPLSDYQPCVVCFENWDRELP